MGVGLGLFPMDIIYSDDPPIEGLTLLGEHKGYGIDKVLVGGRGGEGEGTGIDM